MRICKVVQCVDAIPKFRECVRAIRELVADTSVIAIIANMSEQLRSSLPCKRTSLVRFGV